MPFYFFQNYLLSNLLATQTVIDRIVQNRILYEKRNSSRLKKEEEYIHNKHYVAEI